jgi:hypothetical protein
MSHSKQGITMPGNFRLYDYPYQHVIFFEQKVAHYALSNPFTNKKKKICHLNQYSHIESLN